MKKNNGKWKKLSSEIVHQNPWYLLRHDKVIQPDGTNGDFYLIDVQKTVGIIVEMPDHKIVLIGQPRYPLSNKISWEIVTGNPDKHETLLQAAKRELIEETGLRAKSWEKLGAFAPNAGINNEIKTVYIARNVLKTNFKNPDGSENINLKIVSIPELKRMINRDIIVNGTTLSALTKYFIYKELLKK